MEEQVAIFCDVDDFCKDYEEYCTHYLLMDKNEVVPLIPFYPRNPLSILFII